MLMVVDRFSRLYVLCVYLLFNAGKMCLKFQIQFLKSDKKYLLFSENASGSLLMFCSSSLTLVSGAMWFTVPFLGLKMQAAQQPKQ